MPSSVEIKSVLRSEEHTSELQSHDNLVCRLLLEKKKHVHSPDVHRTADSLSCRFSPHIIDAPIALSALSSPHGERSKKERVVPIPFFFFNDTPPPEIPPFPLPDALPF